VKPTSWSGSIPPQWHRPATAVASFGSDRYFRIKQTSNPYMTCWVGFQPMLAWITLSRIVVALGVSSVALCSAAFPLLTPLHNHVFEQRSPVVVCHQLDGRIATRDFRTSAEVQIRAHRLRGSPPQIRAGAVRSATMVSAQNRRTQERFACIECGFEDHADRVGAINILRAGHARCACERWQSDRQQQEPTEATQELHNAA